MTDAEHRRSALTLLFGELAREGAKMRRNDTLALSCLLTDLSRAVAQGWRFMPGAIRATPGVEGMSDACRSALLTRHLRGDWGNVSPEGAAENDRALAGGGRLHSVYTDVRDGDLFWLKVWVITEAPPEVAPDDSNRLRVETTVLLPAEY
jgi:hypothetical protein